MFFIPLKFQQAKQIKVVTNILIFYLEESKIEGEGGRGSNSMPTTGCFGQILNRYNIQTIQQLQLSIDQSQHCRSAITQGTNNNGRTMSLLMAKILITDINKQSKARLKPAQQLFPHQLPKPDHVELCHLLTVY